MECDPGKDDVSAGSVLKAGPEIGRGVILEKDNVEEEDGCDVTLAVGGVFLEEKIETMVDLNKNKVTSALELNPQVEITEDDLLTILPPEIALRVFMFMDPKDLLKLAQTCHFLRFLSEDDKLWDDKCKEASLSYCLSSTEEELLGLRDTMNSKLHEILKSLNRIEASFEFSRWKANFLKHLRIEMNFRQHPIRRPTILKLNDSPDNSYDQTCMEFVGEKLAFGSAGRAGTEAAFMDVWDPLSGTCLFKSAGHFFGVSMIQVVDPFIISTNHMEPTIKVWNSHTGECLRTLLDPTAPHVMSSCIVSTHLHEGILVSGTHGGTVRLWNVWGGVCTNARHNLWEGNCTNVFQGHARRVSCVQYNGKLVASGSDDSTVKIWNPETNECVHTLSRHTAPILCVTFAGNYVVSLSRDKSIRVCDVVTGVQVHTFRGYETMCTNVPWIRITGEQIGEYGVKLRGNVMASAHTDSTVKIWDTRTWDCLQVLEGPDKHGEIVHTVDFNDKFVVTGSRDGKIKLWDLKTGLFIRDLPVLKQEGQAHKVKKIRMKDTMIACDIIFRNGPREIQVFNFDTNLRRNLNKQTV